jgi:Ni/Co efflux regulator RcnB
MRKLILLAAMAAVAVPTAASAQRQHDVRNDRAVVRNDKRTVQANRQAVRSDRHVLRADQRVAASDRRVANANQRVMRQDRRVAASRNRYVAPIRNWNYRRVSVGYRLQPAFYGSRYYINDYGAYNLQAPHGRWLRWVRYGDDLLLVNIRTGRVLNVVHYRGW